MSNANFMCGNKIVLLLALCAMHTAPYPHFFTIKTNYDKNRN